MAKKVKKKARNTQKEKHSPSPSPKTVSQESTNNAETQDDGTTVHKDRIKCSHMDKGINLDKLSAKLESSDPPKCEDCRGNAVDKRTNKGKGQNGKKGGKNSKSDSKPIWICLECGHFSCGGVGLPNTPQSHAVRHSKQNHHPLAVHYKNPQLLWCFPCSKLVSEENSDVLTEVAKIVKTRPGEKSISVEVEDVWFGSGSVMKSEASSSNGVDSFACSVKGLLNLGNTCFFNSAMQNLLAISKLREYFFKLDDPSGPLTASLKKLFLEMGSESASRSAINPRSLFGSICTKAPQFRGYQQHDSHEFLRCFLDGLSTEELSSRKNGKLEKSVLGPTFVDAIFGGRLSSTVSCLECGHFSTIQEPFLDLSLSVPTKKTPTKRAQPINRAKKSKLPPKRSGKIRPKINREMKSEIQSKEKLVPSSGDSSMPEGVDSNVVALDMGLTPQDLSTITKAENTQEGDGNVVVESSLEDDFSWLDFIGPNHDDVASETNGISEFAEKIEISTEIFSTNEVQFDAGQVQSPESCNCVCSKDYLNLDSCTSMGENESPSRGEIESPSRGEIENPSKGEIENPSRGEIENPSTGEIENTSRGEIEIPSRGENESASRVLGSENSSVPYNEDASSSVEVREETEVSLEFDGFGDLFNELEPEPDNPISEPTEIVINGVVVQSSSDSDPNEVDSTDDSPVSVESCLSFFTKPEILSKKEHAWQCDNCSKILREETIRSRKLKKPVDEIAPSVNGSVEKDALDDEKSLPQDDQETDVNVTKNGHPTVVNSPQNLDSCNGECDSNGVEFVESESLGGKCKSEASEEEEEVDSESLKVKRDATKSILISKAPSILTVHLKRFSQDARGRLSKLSGHVNFGETIDLKPYMDPRCMDKVTPTYRLVGVVEHLGTMRGGHYVAYVRGGGGEKWYHASDAYVREVSFEEVLRSEAYILFYETI